MSARGRGPVVLAKYVLEAVKRRKEGEQKDYQDVIEQLSKKDIKVVVMRRWLQALKMCVSQFNKECDDLVGATLHLSWADQEQEVVEIYIDYLSDLLSAQTFYLKSVLNMLVLQIFKPVPLESEKVYSNTHEALKTILELIPTSPSYLFKVLESKAPFRTKPADQQEVFVRNCLFIISYCPTLSDDIIHLLVLKMTLIDVELPSRSELDEEEGGMESSCDVMQEDTMFDVEMDQGSHADSTYLVPTTTTPTLFPCHCLHDNMTNLNADKLDVMMLTMYEYIEGVCFNEGKLNTDAAVNLFQSLIRSFEHLILPTHALSHVQFLIFRMTIFDTMFPGYFLDFLWDKFQDTNTPAVIRRVSAGYIASFIARAKFVSTSSAKLCLSIMMQWLMSYLDHLGGGLHKPDADKYSVFYSLCQAVFYVFVFRHRSLLEMEGGHQFLRQLNFERLITSQLNPLKICLPSVVEMFAAVASKHEIAFCYTIMEENKRVVLTKGNTSTSEPAAAAILECFFPFDPYCLKRSTAMIVQHYQEWEETTVEDKEGVTYHSHTPSSFTPSSMDSLVHSVTSP